MNFKKNDKLETQLDTPVVVIIFNRPEKTKELLSVIARVKPKKLLIIADGPRSFSTTDTELCQQARNITNQVNWNCEILRNYSDINLGCRDRIFTGLSWVFENVSEAIILEDDCIPEHEFFRYCSELLEKYRNNERIGMISGDNFQNGIKRGSSDYYFSKYCHIWGWATWARAWKYYDVHINKWPQLKSSNWLDSIGIKARERIYWERMFDRVYNKSLDTWDYQWNLACWLNNMISIMPNVNLVRNIGFDKQATHTKTPNIYANMKSCALQFPLRHPSSIIVHEEADRFTSENMFAISMIKRVLNKLFFN